MPDSHFIDIDECVRLGRRWVVIQWYGVTRTTPGQFALA